MKRMFFGALLLLSGIIGMNVLVCLSIIQPWDYNGITGLIGFLLGTNTTWIFIVFLLMSFSGLGISFYEAYVRK